MKGEEPAAQDSLARQIWRSIYQGPLRPRTDRDRSRMILGALVLHNRPVRVPVKTIRYTHTWGLGGMSATLFLLLVVTGVPMTFVYEPSPEHAYGSILAIRNGVLFGSLVRGVHHWSANFLIATLVLHLLRVYFTGAYFAPRQFNWVIGILLLVCALVSNFTGYLLPWDQLSYWAVTIVTGMLGYVPLIGGWLQDVIRGGPEIGSATLVTFYALHTTVIPLAIVVLMAFHFWRIRKARGVVVPRAPGESREEKPELTATLPDLLLRELVVALVLVAFVMLVALVWGAPLGDEANPGMSLDPAKAPWYFMGFQELLIHLDPVFAVLVVPLLAGIGLLLIPYVSDESGTEGIFMMSPNGRRLALMAALCALVLTPLAILADEFWIDFSRWLPSLPPQVSNGLLPVAILLLGLGVSLWVAKQRLGATRNEAIQATFVFLAVAFAVLTVTGVWLRGSAMALVWPWGS